MDHMLFMLVHPASDGKDEKGKRVQQRAHCSKLSPRLLPFTPQCFNQFEFLHITRNPKDLAEMMGHADVDTQFEYVVGNDEVKRAAAAKIGKELSSFVQISEPVSNLIN
jgi:hypothetical protein